MLINSAMVVARLPYDTRRALDATCARLGLRMSEFVRDALLERLEAENAHLPAKVRSDHHKVEAA